MYFFYVDESGSRDPSIGTLEKPKGHLYVLLAVGIYERSWHPFERAISHVKLTLANELHKKHNERFELADCEVKSNWIRNRKARQERSRFLSVLEDTDIERLVATYFEQIQAAHAVILAVVIDKRQLRSTMTHELLHQQAYVMLLERIEAYLSESHPAHQALIVMDDTSRELNRAVAMRHAHYQREGNPRTTFAHIVEYPFFTRSELSNGVQLADLLAYNVYRAFREEAFDYAYFDRLLPAVYQRRHSKGLGGLCIWPTTSPLLTWAQQAWESRMKKAPP